MANDWEWCMDHFQVIYYRDQGAMLGIDYFIHSYFETKVMPDENNHWSIISMALLSILDNTI